MTLDLLLRNPAPPVTPAAAGWRWLSYSSTTVAGSAGIDTGPDEVCLVNLGGDIAVAGPGNYVQNYYAGFAQDEFRATSSVTLNVGVRYEFEQGLQEEDNRFTVGFDPSGVPDPTLPERLEREDGRGLFVLKSLVDQVAFNEKGNSVCLTLRAG